MQHSTPESANILYISILILERQNKIFNIHVSLTNHDFDNMALCSTCILKQQFKLIFIKKQKNKMSINEKD